MSIVERGRDCSTSSFPCVLNVNFYLKKLVTANREEEAILTVKELFHLLVWKSPWYSQCMQGHLFCQTVSHGGAKMHGCWMLRFIFLFPFYLFLEMHQNAPCIEYIVGVGIRIHIGMGITQIKKEKKKRGGKTTAHWWYWRVQAFKKKQKTTWYVNFWNNVHQRVTCKSNLRLLVTKKSSLYTWNMNFPPKLLVNPWTLPLRSTCCIYYFWMRSL